MSSQRHHLGRGVVYALILAALAVTVLVAIGELTSGSRPELSAATDDGLPVELDGSDDEIRNVSIGLGGLAATVLLVTALYYVHTGRVAKDRFVERYESPDGLASDHG